MGIGDTYGKWTVIAAAEPSANKRRRCLCRCSCERAREVTVLENDLKRGKSTSCGCRRSRPGWWTDERITARLKVHAKELGRMPTTKELTRLEASNGLACVISKGIGFRAWAERLGLERKESETHRGQRWEASEKTFFESLGFAVERQTTKAPFDLLVNGHRVDVKSATWTDSRRSKGNKAGCIVRGFVFAGLKRGSDCDFFDLVCLKEGVVAHRFIVPATAAKIVTLTITERTLGGFGKYSSFLDRTDLLSG